MAKGVGGGPKPRAPYLRVISGAGRRGRPPKRSDRPRLVSGNLDAPDFLSEFAKEEWNNTVPELVRIGLVCALDRGSLAAYFTAYSRLRQAQLALRQCSLTIKS